MRDTISRAYLTESDACAIIEAMKVYNDYPDVFEFDSRDSASGSSWWNTLGARWVRVNLITDCLGNTVGESRTSQDLALSPLHRETLMDYLDRAAHAMVNTVSDVDRGERDAL